MIDIQDFLNRCSNIYDFYELATVGLNTPGALEAKKESLNKTILSVLSSPDADKLFLSGKKPPKEFWGEPEIQTGIAKQAQEKITFSLNALKKQTVVMFHSYIEIIMSLLTNMILEKDTIILKRIYLDKGRNIPFNVGDLIDNKDDIISMLVEREVRRFEYMKMENKKDYFQKYFEIQFKWTDQDFGTDIMEIDSLRHDIVHSNKKITVPDDKMLRIFNYTCGLGLNLLFKVRQKFKVNIVWMLGLGRNYLK